MTAAMPPSRPRRHWLGLARRVGRLLLVPARRTETLVRASYDRIANGYDRAWTSHMRDLASAMADQVAPRPGDSCLDLACGTGWLTGHLASRTGTRPVGVDGSAGMLEVARLRHGQRCEFVRADALEFLRGQPTRSVDVVTCAWGLGYMRPWAVLRQIARVLRPKGRFGIIDNSLFSLAEVLWTSLLVFAERPVALAHVMKVRFLPASRWAAGMCRLAGLIVTRAYDGSRAYNVADGQAAIARLTETGAAAGFEFAATPTGQEWSLARFGELLAQRCGGPEGIRITHRYLVVVGRKR